MLNLSGPGRNAGINRCQHASGSSLPVIALRLNTVLTPVSLNRS
jgi:hypothetical protein